MFSKAAIERRLGMKDSRGPEGIMSRGANVYAGGKPNAHSGGGNPNLGRPSTQHIQAGQDAPPPSMTTLVGSLPPNTGNPDETMNDAVMQILRNKFMRGGGGGLIA